MKSFFILIVLILLFFPIVFAGRNDSPPENSECSFFNLKNCFTGFLNNFLNASLKPLIGLVKKLLIESGSPNTFKSLWSFIVFICSFLTTIFLTIEGIKFIIHSDNPVKRYNAKKGLQTIIFILILLPLSFYFYTLILELNASLSNYFLNTTNTNFLEIKVTGLLSSILNLLLYLIYLIVLILTVVILILRYLIISVGVVVFPLGLVFYCFDFVKGYANLIINFLFANIFAGFIGSLTLKIVSMISSSRIFDGYQVVFGIAGFLIMDVILLVCMLFVIFKASFHGVENSGLLKVI